MDIRIRDRVMELPVIQGGMGIGISLGNLAGSVAATGGMGTISMVGIGYREEDFQSNFTESCIRAFKAEVAKAKAIAGGKGIVAVNLMSVVDNYDELEAAIMDSDVDAVVVGAGLPLNLPKANIKNKLLAPIVSGKRALDLICRTWRRRYDTLPDFVVLEGLGAGGHLGFSLEEIREGTVSLKALAGEVADYLKSIYEDTKVKIPFFVAGSTLTSEDLKEFLDIGAAGLQLGTRFLATEEADAHINMKKMIVNSSSRDLEIIKSPVGIYGRALRNTFLDEVKSGRIPPKRCMKCLKPCDPRTTDFCISEKLILTAKGDVENGLVFCGSRVDEINEILTVKQVMEKVTGGVL